MRCRNDCLPIRPIEELVPFLDGVRAGRQFWAAVVTGWVVAEHPFDLVPFKAERTRIMTAIEERLTVRKASPGDPNFVRFTIEPRD